MPTPTYDLIQEQVLGSAAASVTFSSIPGTYKDLVIEVIAASNRASSANDLAKLNFNSDTASNYSRTGVYGTGTTAASFRDSSITYIHNGYTAGDTGSLGDRTVFFQIMSYTNTNVFKTVLSRGNDPASEVNAVVGLWRKSPAEAITTIAIAPVNGTQWKTNSTFRLWGVSG